jgi:hypothetical protein
MDMLGDDADGFTDIMVPVYDAIGLSHTIREIRRTTEVEYVSILSSLLTQQCAI